MERSRFANCVTMSQHVTTVRPKDACCIRAQDLSPVDIKCCCPGVKNKDNATVISVTASMLQCVLNGPPEPIHLLGHGPQGDSSLQLSGRTTDHTGLQNIPKDGIQNSPRGPSAPHRQLMHSTQIMAPNFWTHAITAHYSDSSYPPDSLNLFPSCELFQVAIDQ